MYGKAVQPAAIIPYRNAIGRLDGLPYIDLQSALSFAGLSSRPARCHLIRTMKPRRQQDIGGSFRRGFIKFQGRLVFPPPP
jgi:hypothetical protein